MMMGKNRGLIIAGIGAALILAGTLTAYRTPAPLKLDAAPTEFSAARAQEILKELVERAAVGDFEELKKLVFAALAADLSSATVLRPSIEKVLSEDPALRAVWQAGSGQYERIAQEIGALMTHAEKFRCAECGFSVRSFYWQCPACHAWDSFETYAVIKLR